MVPATLEGKVKRHEIWMKEFLKLVQHSATTKINASKTEKDEKKAFFKILKSRLNFLNNKRQEIKQLLINYLNTKEDKIVMDLSQLFKNEAYRERISTWNFSDCPSPETMDSDYAGVLLQCIKSTAKISIKSRLQEEMCKWFKGNKDISDFQEDFLKEFKKQCRILENESLSIREEMRGLSVFNGNLPDIYENSTMTLQMSNEMTDYLINIGFGLVTVVLTAIFPPIGIISGFLGILFLSVNFYEKRKASKCLDNYIEKRQDFMREWTIQALGNVKRKNIRDTFNEMFFDDTRNLIESLCEDKLPKMMETDRKIMTNIMSDERQADTICKSCPPIKDRAEVYQGKLLLFKLLYLSDIQQNKIGKAEQIGPFVYKSDFFWHEKCITVSLKRFKYPLDDDTIYLQLLEMENHLCPLNEKNVLMSITKANFQQKNYSLSNFFGDVCPNDFSEMSMVPHSFKELFSIYLIYDSRVAGVASKPGGSHFSEVPGLTSILEVNVCTLFCNILVQWILEIDISLRASDHPNVLKIYGASLSDVGEVKYLDIITEFCQMTLIDIIDKTCCCCSLTYETEEFETAFQKFLDINIQIAEGLEHIHDKKCIHSDLTLQNILIQEDSVKIAVAGFLKQTELLTDSTFEALTYKAPETSKVGYPPSTALGDIYSFGIIMWEMWYWRQIVDESRCPKRDSQRDLETRDRPYLLDDLDTFPLLKEILKSCLDEDPSKRPDITQVKEKLEKMKDRYSPPLIVQTSCQRPSQNRVPISNA